MFDVIVIGARCAGSPTAMLLAQRGYRVLLVDRARFPSNTLSTHLLKPRGMAYLAKWGLRGALARSGTPIGGAYSFTRESITLTGAPSVAALRRCLQREHGWDDEALRGCRAEWACVRRPILDAILVDAAAAAGVEVREGFTVEALIHGEDGRVVGIRGRSARGAAVEARAPVIVGADGRRSLVARWVGAPEIASRPQCTYTAYSYYSGVDVDAFAPPVHLRGRLGAGFANTGGGLALVSVWGPGEWFDAFRGDLEENLLRTVGFCAPTLEAALRGAGRREERLFAAPGHASVLRRAAGRGWLLVGDAGCHVDQCTAIGMTMAFRDAELAAAAVDRGLAGDAPLDDALAEYDERRLEMLWPYYEYVTAVAECNLPSREQLQVLAALRGRDEALARFLGFGAAIVPRPEYFSPTELDALIEAAGEAAGDVPGPRELAEQNQSHEQNPWR